MVAARATVGGADHPISADDEGRAVVVDLGSIIVYNVYVPNAGDTDPVTGVRPRIGNKLTFLRALAASVGRDRAAGRRVCVVGDLNVAPGPLDVPANQAAPSHKDASFVPHYSPAEIAAVWAWMNDGQGGGRTLPLPQPGEEEEDTPDPLPPQHQLVDTWRCTHPLEREQYTVWQWRTDARAANVGHRIDVIAVDESTWRAGVAARGGRPPAPPILNSRAVSALPPGESGCETVQPGDVVHVNTPRAWSDHIPVYAVLVVPPPPPFVGPPPPLSSRSIPAFKPPGRSLLSMGFTTGPAKRPREEG